MELRCQHPKSQLASFPTRKLAELISFVLLWPQGSGGAATDISWELDVWCNNTHQASLCKQATLAMQACFLVWAGCCPASRSTVFEADGQFQPDSTARCGCVKGPGFSKSLGALFEPLFSAQRWGFNPLLLGKQPHPVRDAQGGREMGIGSSICW